MLKYSSNSNFAASFFDNGIKFIASSRLLIC
ncbi:hypothetical protein DVU_1739 [Nitratidesulfovibrio vulgaris str. Hildenborough]|uniref:LCI fold domain-containing protein n=1 Tax=Nitratidesulfovibrio vulgaris (strain ATCC 29579 / DSM 644 / CCUG 34227 / NCIMB 8303 / VKM B-1760 / Hildenborough) TaxID=882 RepID=Q72B97_NITV2|nr:hypothetical protein DVU_1739 [Nitratidesulfovibrio vulgaris str. Hildenborough]